MGSGTFRDTAQAMSEERLEIVRTMCASWKSGDFAAGAGDLDVDIVFIVHPSFPEAGIYHGPAGVRDYMRRVRSMWERYTIEAEKLHVVGDTVIAGIRQRGIGKASGVATDVRSHMLFTFRGRKIVRIENMLDDGEAREAAGSSA